MATVSLAEIEANAEQYQLLPNGVWRDRKSGQFCNATGGGNKAITPASSQRMISQRWELARQAAADGLSEAPGMQSDMDTIKHIFKAQAGLAIDTARGHPSTQAAEFIMTKGGYTPDRQSGAAGTTVNIINVVEGAGAADLLREVRDIDVIDME